MSLDLPTPRPARIAILGVGNDTLGDDGAGVSVVRELAARIAATPGLLIIDCGVAPESYTGPLRRFAPDLVIEIDAADQGAAPGAFGWIDWKDADGMSASTHTLPPSVLAAYLTQEFGCRVALIGIQPASLEMGAGPSPAVRDAVSQLAGLLCAWLSK